MIVVILPGVPARAGAGSGCRQGCFEPILGADIAFDCDDRPVSPAATAVDESTTIVEIPHVDTLAIGE